MNWTFEIVLQKTKKAKKAQANLQILFALWKLQALYQSPDKSPQPRVKQSSRGFRPGPTETGKKKAAYSICESWFVILHDVHHDLFVSS